MQNSLTSTFKFHKWLGVVECSLLSPSLGGKENFVLSLNPLQKFYHFILEGWERGAFGAFECAQGWLR